jgi:hypothetical protein
MKISVFVPCIIQHYPYLKKMIDRYVAGTERPDEIVVFLCCADKDKEYESPHSICSIHRVSEKVSVGEVRQKALELCSGDVVMYQDADDMPSRQRVEVVRHYFETEDIVNLTHGQVLKEKELDCYKIDVEKVRRIRGIEIYDFYFPSGILTNCSKVSRAYGGGLLKEHSAGDVCVKREILKEVQWKAHKDLVLLGGNQVNGEDYEFCMEVAYRYKKSLMIDAPLQFYRVLK